MLILGPLVKFFFADDVKVYVGDVAKLQNALDLIIGWASGWQTSLSVNKCNMPLIGKCQDITPYYVNRIERPYLSHCKNLGVIITYNFNYCPQETVI